MFAVESYAAVRRFVFVEAIVAVRQLGYHQGQQSDARLHKQAS